MCLNQVIFITLTTGVINPTIQNNDAERPQISEMRNPETGECIQFATQSEVPDGWMPCFPCWHRGSFHVSGATLEAGDGCNLCQCSDGLLGCTKMFCGDLELPVAEPTPALSCRNKARTDCNETRGCAWLVPGCGESFDTFEAGCFVEEPCNSADDCIAGEICADVTVNPCASGGGALLCSACGLQRTACLPATAVSTCDLECEYGFKQDLSGRTYCECRESAFCAQVLPPPHEDPVTGECVTFPTPCDVPNAWESCALRPEDECLFDADCPAGSLCIRGDVAQCEKMECAYPEDCPVGSKCEGSSMCPRDQICIWEGEPGVCEAE